MRTIRYYAAAKNERGAIGQLLVTVEPGRASKQEWTGKEYRSKAECVKDLERLNVRERHDA